MGLPEVGSHLLRRERELERSLGEARMLALSLADARTQIVALDGLQEACDQAIGFLSTFADERQGDLQRKVEDLVTVGLQAVFGPGMEFVVVPSTRGKLVTTEFLLRTEGLETPIMDARGGGVAAVVGFLLRLVLVMLREDARKILFLDESFAQLSADYEPVLADLIREMVDRTGVQVVLVTHSDAYTDAADRVYRFSMREGQTEVTGG